MSDSGSGKSGAAHVAISTKVFGAVLATVLSGLILTATFKLFDIDSQVKANSMIIEFNRNTNDELMVKLDRVLTVFEVLAERGGWMKSKDRKDSDQDRRIERLENTVSSKLGGRSE